MNLEWPFMFEKFWLLYGFYIIGSIHTYKLLKHKTHTKIFQIYDVSVVSLHGKAKFVIAFFIYIYVVYPW